MSLEDILESLETEAQKQSAEIIARANDQSAKLIAEAKEEAEEILAASKRTAVENLRSQEAKILLEARFKAKKRVAEAKEGLIDKVFAEVEGLVGSARKRPEYDDIFRGLAREALGESHNGRAGLTLEVNPDDLALAKAFVAERPGNNVRVAGREDVNSGVAMLVEGGRKTGVNTLESRFQRAKQLLRTKVGATLFDDHN